MNRKLFIAAQVVLLALACGAMAVSASKPTGQLDFTSVPTLADSPVTTVSTGITYQGRLKNGGTPANGQFDLVFKLYDALSAGNQVGSPITVTNQTVTEGLFTVQLDFGSSVFWGEARWLEIAARASGGGSYATLSPRQPLTAAPYALSLKPGAVITTTVGSNPALSAFNFSTGTGLSGSSDNGRGVYGFSDTAWGIYGFTNTGYGVYGYGGTASSVGVYGTSNSGKGVQGFSSTNNGVYGTSSSNHALYGQTSGSAVYAGVYGNSTTTNGNGVIGEANIGSAAYGVWGKSTTGYGVYGTGGTGVYGTSPSGGTGVLGASTATGGTGVYGTGNVYGVRGIASGQGAVAGVYGETGAANARSVYGNNTSSLYGVGVYGETSSPAGDGVYGYGPGGYGVHGESNNGSGVFGQSINGYGVYGFSQNFQAGHFDGSVEVTGNLSKGGGSFKIDHPLDPANRYLYHSFVESPDMMDIYNGNVTLDGSGEAWVEMPAWFEALNRDFRYQLTAVGAPGPNLYVSEKVKGNRFKIAGGTAGMEVSWMVTGVRHDPYAEKHRIPVEEDKPADEKGKYLHPTERGMPETLGVDYERTHNTRQKATGR
jgi:hypothetical protein